LVRKRVATITSNIINPFVLAVIVIVLLALDSAVGMAEGFRWAAIAIAVTVVPGLIIVSCLVSKGRLDGFFINARNQRWQVYICSAVIAVIAIAVLFLIDAPMMLIATFVAGLALVLIFMLINHWWKISVHTAFASASSTILIIIFGPASAFITLTLPLVGWSRVELKRHTPWQVVAGAAVSAVIVVVVFELFGVFSGATAI